MDRDESELASKQTEALGRRQLGGGRLGTYTVLGAASGVVPLPWIPDAIVRRVRGALVYDVTSRHGLSLTPEARSVLVEPTGTEGPRGFLASGVTFAIGKVLGRFGPLGLVPPIRSALGTFVLGHLLQRYLDTARTTRAVRIDVEEARKIRRAIDQSLIYAITTEPRRASNDGHVPAEDLRDPSVQVVDGVLVSIANVPGWVVRRLDAAFDEVISSVRA